MLRPGEGCIWFSEANSKYLRQIGESKIFAMLHPVSTVIKLMNFASVKNRIADMKKDITLYLRKLQVLYSVEILKIPKVGCS